MFCKKSGKWGVFFVKKSGKCGCFVKSGPFLNAGCIMYTISIFLILHYTYLGECVRTQCPPAYGPEISIDNVTNNHENYPSTRGARAKRKLCRPPQSCPRVELTQGLGWVGSRFSVFGGLDWVHYSKSINNSKGLC